MWLLYMSILMVGFISGVYTDMTCPEKGDIYPCTCVPVSWYMVNVTCSRGSFIKPYPLKVLQHALSSLKGKTDVYLQFEDCHISVPTNFFAGIDIWYLGFHSCRIESLGDVDEPALTGLEKDLEWLSIVDSSFVPPTLNLGHMKKLHGIDWWGSNLTEITDDWLTYSYSLQHLSIQRSNVTKIGSYAFYHLVYLYNLELEDISFGPIQRTMLPRAPDRMKILMLENDALTDLPVDLFSGMPALQYVSFRRNNITTLDERTWSPIWQQLHWVWLEDNNIVCDERLGWITKTGMRESPGEISGNCSAPKEFEGMPLYEFLFYRS